MFASKIAVLDRVPVACLCENASFENCDLAAHVPEPFRICVACCIFTIKALEMIQSDGHMEQLDEFMREVDGLSLA